MNRPRRISAVWLLFSSLLLSLAVPRALADVAAEVQAVTQDKVMRKATLGVSVVRIGASAGEDKVLFEHGSDKQFIPASNLKLVTTAAALETFGPAFKFKTVLLRVGDDLVLIGDGDPALGDAEYLKKAGWKSHTLFEWWASQLKDRLGVRTVRDVIIDDGVFDDQFVHPRWPADQLHKRYCPELAGLNFNANCVDFQVQAQSPGQVVAFQIDPATRYVTVRNSCVGGKDNSIWLSRDPNRGNEILLRGEAKGSTREPVSVTIHDPGAYTGTVLAETLTASGIARTGKVRRERGFRARRERGDAPVREWQVVGIHETPLSTVLLRANKDSMNLYAESLCKRLGFEASGGKEAGSWANGTAAMGKWLKSIGVADGDYAFDDGSGMSRQNLVTPRALTKVLSHEFHGRNRDGYLVSLSVAGVDGTLEDRFKAPYTDLRGRVIGKSGYVNGVRTLSGYLKAKDGNHYAFSILMNGLPEGDAQAKVLQERIVRAIDTQSTAVAAGE